MKKLNTLILTVVLCACLSVSIAGCETYNENDDWIEVQSITYTTDKNTTTLTSAYFYNFNNEASNQDEFETATLKAEYEFWERDIVLNSFTRGHDINSKKQEIKDVENIVGNTYYLCFKTSDSCTYEKITIIGYNVKYVTLKIEDTSISIKYDGKTSKVVPITYEITYFEN